jgi:hypothetical protein
MKKLTKSTKEAKSEEDKLFKKEKSTQTAKVSKGRKAIKVEASSQIDKASEASNEVKLSEQEENEDEEEGAESKIDEMLRIIENIDSEIEKHKHFKEINEEIAGVPIRFVLVPIKNFIDNCNVEPKYGKLPDTTLNDYSTMLKNMLDFKAENCIRDRVFEGYRESGNIIFNRNSKISKSIKEYEDEINKFTNKFYPIAVNGLKYYRSDNKVLLKSLIKNSLIANHKEDNLQNNLNTIILEINSKLNMTYVQGTINKFIEECKYQLEGIKFRDGEKQKNKYRLFTDEDSLFEWFKSDRCTKILLKTDGKESKKCNFYI